MAPPSEGELKFMPIIYAFNQCNLLAQQTAPVPIDCSMQMSRNWQFAKKLGRIIECKLHEYGFLRGGGSNLFASQSNFQNQDGGCSLFFFFLNSWMRLEVERAEKVDLKSSIHLSFKTVFPQFDPVIIYITRLETS